MKLCIFGSRGLTIGPSIISLAIQRWALVDSTAHRNITEVVSGDCPNSPDVTGNDWATAQGIKVHHMPADWAKQGRAAGYRRNQDMVDYSDAGLAIWDGESKGTAHSIAAFKKADKPVYVLTIDGIYSAKRLGMTHMLWVDDDGTVVYGGGYRNWVGMSLVTLAIREGLDMKEL